MSGHTIAATVIYIYYFNSGYKLFSPIDCPLKCAKSDIGRGVLEKGQNKKYLSNMSVPVDFMKKFYGTEVVYFFCSIFLVGPTGKEV